MPLKGKKTGLGSSILGNPLQKMPAVPKQNKKKDSKLKVSPDGMCTCPICGQKHLPGGAHGKGNGKDNGKNTKITKPAAINPPLNNPAQPQGGGDNQNDISTSKV